MNSKDIIEHIVPKILRKNENLYFYGSTARNLRLKVPSYYYYMITSANLVTISECFDNIDFPGKPDYDAEVRLDGNILRFKSFPNLTKDFLTLKEIASQEIFTIDTMFFDALREVFIDPFDCYYDVRNKLLKPSLKFSERYKADSLKIFDGFYLMAEYGFTFSQELEEKCLEIPFRINEHYMEEIRRSLELIFTGSNPYGSLVLMDRYNILTEIFPHMKPSKSFHQDKDYHPEGNVFEHTLECFKYLKKPSLRLSLALLLHDVGKPETAEFVGKNLRFPGHSRAGAIIATKALSRLGYDREFVEDVSFLIKYHLLAHEFRKTNEEGRNKIMAHKMFPELLKLYKADVQSCYGDLKDYRKILSLYERKCCK